MYCNACGKAIAEDGRFCSYLRQRGGDCAHAEETDAFAHGPKDRRRLCRAGSVSRSRRFARAYPVVLHHARLRNLPGRRGLRAGMDHYSGGTAVIACGSVATAGNELAE